jgi:hypothetical protein
MKKLWKIEWDLWYGALYGIFIATDEEVKSLIGKELYMGEVNGKHSEVCWTVEDGDIELFSDDEYVISCIKPFGYNPFDYLGEEETQD